jgi:hypothetical protein
LGAIARKRFHSDGAELLRREDIGDDEIIADAGADHVFLLGARLRQPLYGFDRSQDVDVGDAVAFGIPTGLHSRTREDRRNPVPDGMIGRSRIGQSDKIAAVVVLIEGHDQEAVVILRPSIIVPEAITQPKVACLDEAA